MNMQHYENITVTLMALFTSVIVIYYLMIKHRERMEMIRMQQIPEEEPEQRNRSVLGKAIMMLALGIGLVSGMCLTDSYPNLPALILYLVMILFFCGIGLLIYYLILRKAR